MLARNANKNNHSKKEQSQSEHLVKRQQSHCLQHPARGGKFWPKGKNFLNNKHRLGVHFDVECVWRFRCIYYLVWIFLSKFVQWVYIYYMIIQNNFIWIYIVDKTPVLYSLVLLLNGRIVGWLTPMFSDYATMTTIGVRTKCI